MLYWYVRIEVRSSTSSNLEHDSGSCGVEGKVTAPWRG
jgi:hypothetical protein